MHTTKVEITDSAFDLGASTDEKAIELVRAGNPDAFEIIMRRYNQRLYRVARSILGDKDTAQDAVQQAYISAYYKLDQYKSDKSFGAWITRITINEALMIKRKPDNRLTDTTDALTDNIPDAGNNPVAIHANKELAFLIESAIDKLPDDFRYVFVLRSIQQLSIRETAESLSINETTVKTRLHRAHKLIQRTLKQHIEHAGMHVFEFAGKRCDRMVRVVLENLRGLSAGENNKTRTH